MPIEPPMPNPHADDIAIDRFAAAMKARMAEMRAKGRSGWETCPAVFLHDGMLSNAEQGEPRDTANYAMMLWNIENPET